MVFFYNFLTDLDECSSPESNDCDQICNNFPGTYNCSCIPGYIRKGFSKCEGVLLYIKHSSIFLR